MTVIVGVIGAAVLFGLFSMLRTRDKAGCTGHCAGCTAMEHARRTERNDDKHR